MKLIFLDRDGVINEDPANKRYVTQWEDFHFLPHAIKAVKKLNDNGFEIAILSNQAGVAKGLFTLERLNEITQRMVRIIETAGARIRSIHYCPHGDEDNCDCRKPKTGLFQKAVVGLDIDFKATYFIGDGVMDVEAGKAMGCKTILVLCGKTKRKEVDNWKVKPDYIVKDLWEAVNVVLEKNEICSKRV